MQGWELPLKFLKNFAQPPAQETTGSGEIVCTEFEIDKAWFFT